MLFNLTVLKLTPISKSYCNFKELLSFRLLFSFCVIVLWSRLVLIVLIVLGGVYELLSLRQ